MNGEKQIPCKLKNQQWNETIGGRILEFKSDDHYDYTLLDATNAYPGNELKSWRRQIILDKPVTTVVLDEVKCTEGAEIEVRFHSAAQQHIREHYALLKKQ